MNNKIMALGMVTFAFTFSGFASSFATLETEYSSVTPETKRSPVLADETSSSQKSERSAERQDTRFDSESPKQSIESNIDMDTSDKSNSIDQQYKSYETNIEDFLYSDNPLIRILEAAAKKIQDRELVSVEDIFDIEDLKKFVNLKKFLGISAITNAYRSFFPDEFFCGDYTSKAQLMDTSINWLDLKLQLQ